MYGDAGPIVPARLLGAAPEADVVAPGRARSPRRAVRHEHLSHKAVRPWRGDGPRQDVGAIAGTPGPRTLRQRPDMPADDRTARTNLWPARAI
jgi:hypothetical protein